MRRESSRKNQNNRIIPWPLQLVCANTGYRSRKKNAILSQKKPNEWVSRYKRLKSLVNFQTQIMLLAIGMHSLKSRDVRRWCFDAIVVVRARASPHTASGLLFGNAVGDFMRHLHHPRLLEDAACGAFAKGGTEFGQVCLGLRARDVQRLGLGRQSSHAR